MLTQGEFQSLCHRISRVEDLLCGDVESNIPTLQSRAGHLYWRARVSHMLLELETLAEAAPPGYEDAVVCALSGLQALRGLLGVAQVERALLTQGESH